MKPKALLTTIPSDSHNWNLIYMQLLLEENGYEVTNLGACTTYDEVEQACVRLLPEIIVVSSVNGHGFIEGQELIRKIRGIAQMKEVRVFLGGKLSTDKNMSYIYALELEMAGYTKVYYENVQDQDFIRKIRSLTKRPVGDINSNSR